ncbi:MAG: hypothetical protein MZV63_32440 [Marinilabiliales bacterium]|nr:hypothetical protein [Marinilabiliales bacterium]
MSIAPMMTAVEFMLSPTEAMMIAKTENPQVGTPEDEVLLNGVCIFSNASTSVKVDVIEQVCATFCSFSCVVIYKPNILNLPFTQDYPVMAGHKGSPYYDIFLRYELWLETIGKTKVLDGEGFALLVGIEKNSSLSGRCQ